MNSSPDQLGTCRECGYVYHPDDTHHVCPDPLPTASQPEPEPRPIDDDGEMDWSEVDRVYAMQATIDRLERELRIATDDYCVHSKTHPECLGCTKAQVRRLTEERDHWRNEAFKGDAILTLTRTALERIAKRGVVVGRHYGGQTCNESACAPCIARDALAKLEETP